MRKAATLFPRLQGSQCPASLPTLPPLLTSKQLSGGNKNSLSPGYCDTHDRSAPMSTRPAAISNTVPRPRSRPLYCTATRRSVVVDMNPHSTPPRSPPPAAATDLQNCSGSSIPPSPRHRRRSGGTAVRRESLRTPLMMQKSVVSYLRQQDYTLQRMTNTITNQSRPHNMLSKMGTNKGEKMQHR